MPKKIPYEMGRLGVWLYSKLFLRLDIAWCASLPPGPKLFASNHPSASDPFLIHLLSPMSVLITANAFAFPIFGSFLRLMGQIQAAPGGDSLEQALGLLREGYPVGIFPEGTYSPQSGGFGEAHSGAARLALQSGVPVIPVGIYLPMERSLRITSNLSGRQTVGYWYLSGPYSITVGEAMRFEGDPDDRGHVQIATDAMMTRIKSLAGESQKRQQG